MARLDRDHEQRGNRASDLSSHQSYAGDRSTLGWRKPARGNGAGRREGSGFSRSEAKTDEEEDVVVRGRAGERSEDRPPEDDAREDSPRAETVGKGAGRNFEQAVRQREDAGDPAPVDGVDVEFLLHPRA